MSRRSFDDGLSTDARQGLLDNRCEHGPKRHRTNKRAKALSAKKRSASAHKRAVNDGQRRRKLKAARAYWQGDANDHPK